jgi:cysteinyl-tRNA synthetase
VTPAELLAQGHKGETLRLALLSAHYRQPLAWTDDLIAQSKKTLDRLYRNIFLPNRESEEVDIQPVVDALDDDLNTPLALSRLIEISKIGRSEDIVRGAALLGLLNHDPQDWFRGSLPPGVTQGTVFNRAMGPNASQIEQRITERTEAKKNRDFATADRIRDELKAEGILLEDSASGTTWRRE